MQQIGLALSFPNVTKLSSKTILISLWINLIVNELPLFPFHEKHLQGSWKTSSFIKISFNIPYVVEHEESTRVNRSGFPI